MGPEHARLERILEFARRQFEFDVVYLFELRAGRIEVRAVAGDADSFRVGRDGALACEDSYTHRMMTGQIPSFIPDVRWHPELVDLEVTRTAAIGCYVGVPVRRPGGAVWGALTGLNHAPRPDLDERLMASLALLADLVCFDAEDYGRREQVRRDIKAFSGAGGFDVAYQPIMDVQTGQCLGLEALARFPDPYAAPDELFNAAEQAGLGIELERAVARRALEVVPSLSAGQFLALNMSPNAMLERARSALSRGDLPLSKVVVELTERASIAAYGRLRDDLRPLRERGLRIAVDDAGAGYASLRHVLELRPDFIKLDRWLIDGLADDRARRVAVFSFVALARELGARVIAEGVERSEDLAAVRELGLHAAQGYLLGRPSTSPDVVSTWCSDSNSAATAHPASASHVDPAPEEATCGEPVTAWTGAGLSSIGRELERLEFDRRVSQRLEAVGQLAAGIAHEINTPLQYVGDSVSFLQDAVKDLLALLALHRDALQGYKPDLPAPTRQALLEAEEDADIDYLSARIPAAFDRTADGIARVRSIVQAMKRFSHAAGNEVAPADINDALRTTLVVCRNEYKYIADVTLDLDELPEVVCNISELNQVFLNLIINAAQAIEDAREQDGDRAQITITTRRRGDSVVIKIADTGPGIPPAIIDRIYDPFFTTKPVGRGSGQGLALALATIQRHAGSLRCQSTQGRGTTFTIQLPLQAAAAPSRETAAA